jgi:hypothetical protein
MHPVAEAARYLEQGEWQKAHVIVQDDESPLGCWAHGIVHLQEGDVGNARYWYGRAGRALPRDSNPMAEVTALSDAQFCTEPRRTS